MVRLLIPLVAVALIWLLFFSPLSKKLRIGLSIGVVAVTLLGLWLDINGRGVSSTLITPAEVVICGVDGQFSYRSNYNLSVCLENTASQGDIKRLRVEFSALDCATGSCQTVDTREETLNIVIAAGDKLEHVENVAFKNLPSTVAEPVFTAQVLEIWASR